MKGSKRILLIALVVVVLVAVAYTFIGANPDPSRTFRGHSSHVCQ